MKTSHPLSRPELRKCGSPAWRFLVLLLTGLCAGCVVIPVPELGRTIKEEYRNRVTTLQAAAASRETVIQTIGRPSRTFEDLRVLAYTWTTTEWGFYWAYFGADPYTIGADAGYTAHAPRRVLWLSFDERDRLMHWKLTGLPGYNTTTEWEAARRWRESINPPLVPAAPKRFALGRPPLGKALVHLFWDKGQACPHVLPVRVNHQRQADIRYRGFTSFVWEPGHYELEILPRPLALDLAPDEVCYLNFRPEKKAVSQGRTLSNCAEPEALRRLKHLTYCK